MMAGRVLVCAMVISGAAASVAGAQDEPIPRFVADVRGAVSRFKADAGIASAAGVEQTNLPTRGFGLVGGAHFYPLRTKKITFGLGAQVLVSRGSRTPPSTQGAPAPPTARTHFSAISPELSFNFGHRNGWSYISGGLASATFYVDRTDKPLTGSHPRTKSLNYGGGARWFTKKHIAFSADLRFYALSPQEATPTTAAMPRTRNMVFSVGVGFR